MGGPRIPHFMVFHIRVQTLTLALPNVSDIIISQGDMSAVINQTNLPLITNGLPSKVFYNVTRSPVHGQLYVNDVPVEEPGDPGCPAAMARIEDFCIDRYEAMLVEVLADDSLAPWSPKMR
jgi:hypothetical protein